MKKLIPMRRMTTWALGACLLVSVVSCGSDDDDSGSGSSSTPQPEEETVEGVFNATLTSLNDSVSSATGTSVMSVLGDQLTSRVVIAGARASSHPQFVWSGSRCPTGADDTDGDGYISLAEAQAVVGTQVLALDDDLDAEGGESPSGIAYSYNEEGSVAQVLSSTGATSLDFSNKVVMVHGVPDSANIPATAGDKATLPIACGVLTATGGTGTTTGDTGTTTTGDTGTTTGDTGTTTTGDTGTTTGDTGTTTGETGTTTGTTGTTTGV